MLKGTHGQRRKPCPPDAKPKPRPECKSTRDQSGLGRKSEYSPAYIKVVKGLIARFGYTDQQIADFLEVSRRTLCRWKMSHPDFWRAFDLGEDKKVQALEDSMFALATGHTVPDMKIFPPREVVKGRGKNKRVGLGPPIMVPFERYIPPDPQAARLLLMKLRPKEYSNRVIHGGDPNEPVQFIMSNRPPKEEDDD